MSDKRIFSVGFEFPGNEGEHIELDSGRSLLDADVIVFEPRLPSGGVQEYYRGSPVLYPGDSFAFQRNSAHWRSELRNAFDAGKTIFIYLPTPQDVYVHTGEHTFSGTGRAQVRTDAVTPVNNYKMIPFELGGYTAASGEGIRPVGELGFLSVYWNLCSTHTKYKVYLGPNLKEPVFVTKTGGRVLGAIIRGEIGVVVFLPHLEFPPDFTRTRKDKEFWSAKATSFGKRLSTCFAEIDRALASERGETPPPDWAQTDDFKLDEEFELEKEISGLGKTITELEARRSATKASLQLAGKLRGLLFEKGKPLEHAIIEALRLMGFSAERIKDGESEFDAVFSSPEGRCLGEAEGKDSKAVNIDKLSQLERNLQEDFGRQETEEFAKGVLFGNAHRLTAHVNAKNILQ